MMQRYFQMIYWAVMAYILTANAASAGPVFFAAMAGGASFGAAIGATALGGFLSTVGGRLLASVAISALQGAMKPKPKTAGITTSSTATGGTNPVGFMLGSYATAGEAVCPPMTHGKVKKTPNAYLTYVIALGDIAGQTLERIAINGAWVNGAETVNGDYGTDLEGKYAGWAWYKYYDGSQTAADPMLLAKYGSYPERPWQADMIGRGVPYVIMTFRYNREVFSDFPSVMFQCGGIKLYDPRKDSTIGGSGAHRWGQPATYQQSNNPMVQSYNIARGIAIAGLGVWGGNIEAADLPIASWFSAMNTCDVTMPTTGGFWGSLFAFAQFSTGYEVRVDMEPAAVMEELLKGCVGQIAEVGGEFKVRVGGPGLPVMFLTDDDIVVSKAQDFDPFPQADGRQNGIDAKYPDPEIVWQSKSAPSLYNTAWELEDGDRRVVSLDLPAVPYRHQVQRIMQAYIRDERRFRAHNMTLPPDAAILEPLDVISWTSARNSYTGKLFDLSQLADDIPTLLQRVSVREVDASDFVFTGSITTIAMPSPIAVVPPAQTLDDWAVQPLVVTDGAGAPRKPGIVMTWSSADMDGVDAVEYQVCIKASGSIIKVGAVYEAASGRIPLSEGIVQGVIYQARGRPVVRGRAATWTDWLDVTAPMVGIADADLGAALLTKINETLAMTEAAQENLSQLTAGLLTEVDGALAAIEARTKAGMAGWLTDPIFARWSGTPLNLTAANWFSRTGTATYASRVTGLFGSAMAINVPTGTGVVQLLARNDSMANANVDEPYLVLTAMIEMIAGDLNNAALRVEWSPDGSTWTKGGMLGLAAPAGTFAQHGIALQSGLIQTIERLVKRPVGAFAFVRVMAYPKTSSVTTAHQSVWHLLQVRAATQADIDAGQVYTVAGVTPGTTQTVQGIGAAMAATNSGLTAQVGGVAADLSTNYSTTATMKGAIAASSDKLSARIDGNASKQHFDFRFGDHAWAASYTQSVANLDAAAFPSVAYADVTLPIIAGIGSVFQAGPMPASRNITERTHRPFVLAQKLRFRMKTRVTANPTTGSHLTRFYIAMTDAAGAYLGFTSVAIFAGTVAADGWVIKEFIFEPQAIKAAGAYAATAVNWRLMVQISGLNGATQQVEWIELEDVTFEKSTDSLFADITDIKAVSVSNLTGTALGALLLRLGVGAGGTSAWVESQSSAVANLEGYAAATYSLRVGAGGASAGFEIVATDDPVLGPASTIKLSAKHFEVLASSMRISGDTNLFPDFDMRDPLFYSSATGAVISFIGTTTATLGLNFLNIAANAAMQSVASNWFSVEPSTEYLISGAAWLSATAVGQGTATLVIETGSIDAAGAVTVVTSTTVQTRTDLNYAGLLSSLTLATGPTERRARFRVVRAAGGSGSARAGGFKVQKKAGASLMVDGLFALTGMGIFGGNLQSDGYVAGQAGWRITDAGGAEFNDLVVRQSMLQPNAVSFSGVVSPVSSPSFSTTPVVLAGTTLTGLSFVPILPLTVGVQNPIEIFVSGIFFTTTANAKPTRVAIAVEGLQGSTWSNVQIMYISIPANMTGVSFLQSYTLRQFITTNTQDYTGLRLTGSVAAADAVFSGQQVLSSNFQYSFRQQNR